MSRSARFFDIIQILRQTEKPVIARELAKTLEVNVRTIYRDIATLQASSVPIVGEAGIGYVMQKGFDLPPVMFSTEEIEAICVGLSMIGRSGDDGLMKAAESVLGKISLVSETNLESKNQLRVSSWNKIPASSLNLKQLRKIIREETELTITYKDVNGHLTGRRIKPIMLYYYIDAIILVAWCELRNAFRHFRVDQIQKWEITGAKFTGESIKLREKWESCKVY